MGEHTPVPLYAMANYLSQLHGKHIQITQQCGQRCLLVRIHADTRYTAGRHGGIKLCHGRGPFEQLGAAEVSKEVDVGSFRGGVG